MTAVPEEQISDWAHAIARLHEATVRDEDAYAAYEGASNLWSGLGYQDAPLEVLRMFSQAIEIGYAAALQDVREGDLTADAAGT